MAMNRRLVSNRYPYLPLHLQVRQKEIDVEALIDTGFDGGLAVPSSFIAESEVPNGHHRWKLADNSIVAAPFYLGTVGLGEVGSFIIAVTLMGDEFLIGQGLLRRFIIIFDHGRRVIVEP